jgi:hypothetical protein
MAALAWLLIPLVAAIGAGLWGSWANARFRAAMEKSRTSG